MIVLIFYGNPATLATILIQMIELNNAGIAAVIAVWCYHNKTSPLLKLTTKKTNDARYRHRVDHHRFCWLKSDHARHGMVGIWDGDSRKA